MSVAIFSNKQELSDAIAILFTAPAAEQQQLLDKYGPFSHWNVSQITDMSYLFSTYPQFNQPIDGWDVSRVTNMAGMFRDCISFNQPIGNWDVSNVTDMQHMFANCVEFQQPLPAFVTASVTNTSNMFAYCSSFNQPIGDWNVSSVTTMEGMFANCHAFNHPIGDWNVSSVTTMEGMFMICVQFDQPLPAFVTASVTNTSNMFSYCYAFNQPIGDWNVSSVTTMESMFSDCASFDQPIGNWNVANVTNVSQMFEHCTAFAQDLSAWHFNAIPEHFDFLEHTLITTMIAYYPTQLQHIQLEPPMFSTFQDSRQFNAMMSTFNANPQLTSNPAHYIDDKILNTGQSFKYLVHYEYFNGTPYPIITIPKGVALFTSRVYQTNSNITSFNHLYKLYDNATLNKYSAYDFEDALTFFFPIPLATMMVQTGYRRMDIVTLTTDIRLLCLISPSQITRGTRHDHNVTYMNNQPVYPKDSINKCTHRDCDLCITSDIIIGLNLNGYIGLAVDDSVSSHMPKLKQKISAPSLDKLVQSCIFNNEIKPLPGDATNVAFSNRDYGTPEIVLIPFDIHNHSAQYETIYASYQTAAKFSSNQVDSTGFIFKPFAYVDGYRTLDLVQKMVTLLENNHNRLGRCMLAGPLLNVVLSEVDPQHIESGFIKQCNTADLTLQDVAFPLAYSNYGVGSFCAFELYGMYTKMAEAQTGGGATMVARAPAPLQQLFQTPSTPSSARLQNSIPKQTNNGSLVKINEPDFCYAETTSGIPILIISKAAPSASPLGGKRRVTRRRLRKHSRRQSTKRRRSTKHRR